MMQDESAVYENFIWFENLQFIIVLFEPEVVSWFENLQSIKAY